MGVSPTGNLLTFGQALQGSCCGSPTRPFLAVLVGAALSPLGGINPEEADAGCTDVEGVAVKNFRCAGDGCEAITCSNERWAGEKEDGENRTCCGKGGSMVRTHHGPDFLSRVKIQYLVSVLNRRLGWNADVADQPTALRPQEYAPAPLSETAKPIQATTQ